jgi:hypothetical protein
VVVLQTCVNLLEVVPGSSNEQCFDGYQFMHIKVEEVADIIENEEDPVAEIKSESEVSLCPCVHAASPPYF